ncbi:MAG: siderophore-interacting protein [Bacteroidota bacterium]
MPTLPKWIANGIEKVFSGMMHPVSVTQTEMLAPQLKRVRFEGDLSQSHFIPGQVVEFRISDTEYRHYTPSAYEPSAGACEVLFYLHGLGPGSNWASQLDSGYVTKLMGPGGKMKLRETQTRHLLFGDESSLGFCLQMAEAIKARRQAYFCLLELDRAHQHWPGILGLSTEMVPALAEAPGQNAIKHLSSWLKEAEPAWTQAACYLTGRAASIKLLRKHLIKQGISSPQIQSLPYWAKGKVGI